MRTLGKIAATIGAIAASSAVVATTTTAADGTHGTVAVRVGPFRAATVRPTRDRAARMHRPDQVSVAVIGYQAAFGRPSLLLSHRLKHERRRTAQQRFQSTRVNLRIAREVPMKIWRIAVATGLILGWLSKRRRSAYKLYQAHDRRPRKTV